MSKLLPSLLLNCLVSILLFGLLSFSSAQTIKSGCQVDPTLCDPTGGICMPSGICLCHIYYTGDSCQLQSNSTINFVAQGISDATLTGVILAWLVGVPVIFGSVFYICYKNRN